MISDFPISVRLYILFCIFGTIFSVVFFILSSRYDDRSNKKLSQKYSLTASLFMWLSLPVALPTLMVLVFIQELVSLFRRLLNMYRCKHKKVITKETTHPTKQTLDTVANTPISYGFSIARGLWLSVRYLCDKLGITPSIRHQAYIWTAFLYVIAKNFRSQSLVDDIYINFREATKSHFRDTFRGADPYIAILGAYREFREVLNKSRIDPRSDEGLASLWYMVRQWAYPDQRLPENAFDVFSKSCSMALFIARKDISKSSTPHETKYSISEMDCTLPEHS